ncbi:MAG: DUF952 domain-containing protein [Granulosicoccus sp.]|nr:DUF952 domain-containing protein [Granulosicoccus sp.]
MSDRATIFHIARNAELSGHDKDRDYRCASLDSEGFIHCCDRRQLAAVAARYFMDVDDVQLMIIAVDNLEAPLIHENTRGTAELFPHVYGPINHAAIVEIVPFGIHSADRMGLCE